MPGYLYEKQVKIRFDDLVLVLAIGHISPTVQIRPPILRWFDRFRIEGIMLFAGNYDEENEWTLP